MTKRPQNRCGACGYTWYPRGKDRSLQCPNCKSRATLIVPTPAVDLGSCLGGLLVVVVVLFCLLSGGGTQKQRAPAPVRPDPVTPRPPEAEREVPRPPPLRREPGPEVEPEPPVPQRPESPLPEEVEEASVSPSPEEVQAEVDRRARRLVVLALNYLANNVFDRANEKLDAAEDLGPSPAVQGEIEAARKEVLRRMRR